MGRRTTRNAVEQPKVRCCDCQLAVRDTSGRSFSALTGEYFMGTCPKGHGDGIPGRVFMDKVRNCKDIKSKD